VIGNDGGGGEEMVRVQVVSHSKDVVQWWITNLQ